jgi:glucokinase
MPGLHGHFTRRNAPASRTMVQTERSSAQEGRMAKETPKKPVVGLDMGGTKILAGVVDETGKILGVAKRPTKAHAGPDEIIERMAKTVLEAVDRSGLKIGDIQAVGVGTPGPLDPDEGIIWHTPNLPGWVNLPLAASLQERLDVPIFIDNDVNMGTLGELALGAAKGTRDAVGIFVGTGIGGGLILDGELRQGFRKNAAEVGHMVILADGPYCGCGKRGCAESVASRTAIERDIRAGLRAGRKSMMAEVLKGEPNERITSGALAQAYRAGDPLVTEVVGRAQYYLGLLVSAIVNLVDLEVVVFGGGVVEALGDDFLAPIRPIAYQYCLNQEGIESVKIVPASLGDNAALLGASVYARRRLAKK